MSSNIQILLVGRNHDHVIQTVEYYDPIEVWLITSELLKEETQKLQVQLNNKKRSIQIMLINPFLSDSLRTMTHKLIILGENVMLRKPNTPIFWGLTGGTNLMVMASGLAALHFGHPSHYLAEGKEEIYKFDIDKMLIEIKKKLEISNKLGLIE